MKAEILAAVLAASSAAASPAAAGQRSETGNPLLDYKLRASRAERAHEDLGKAADEIVELSADLARRAGGGEALGPDDAKALGRVRKLAKRIRSDLGGSGDPRLADPPRTLRDAAAALAERGETLADQVRRSSRFELNARLVTLAGEVMALADLIKKFRE
jgi:hypothetical protein